MDLLQCRCRTNPPDEMHNFILKQSFTSEGSQTIPSLEVLSGLSIIFECFVHFHRLLSMQKLHWELRQFRTWRGMTDISLIVTTGKLFVQPRTISFSLSSTTRRSRTPCKTAQQYGVYQLRRIPDVLSHLSSASSRIQVDTKSTA